MRYFNASSQPYITDFVPQDLNLIYKMQQDMVNEDNQALAGIEQAKNAFNVQPGYSTNLEAQRLNQAYNQEANKISEELATGKLNSRDASRRALTLINHFNTNPEVQLVKRDASYTPQVKQMLKDNPGFLDNGLAQGWNPQTKSWNRINPNYSLDDFDKHYEGLTPITYTEDFKDWYSGIKSDLDKELEKETWNRVPNADGSFTDYSTVNSQSKEQITRDKVRKLAKSLVEGSEGIFNKQSVRYDKLKNAGLTNDEIVENLVNSYPGYYSKNIESQKQGRSYTSKAPKQIEEPLLPTSRQSEGINQDALFEDETKDFEFNKDGSLKVSYNQPTVTRTSASLYNDAPIITNKNKTENTQKLKEQTDFINQLKINNPEFKNLNPKETIEVYRLNKKSVTNESGKLYSISGNASEDIGKSIVKDKQGRNFYLWDGKGRTSNGTLDEVLNELDITEEDFNKVLEKGIGGFTQAGPVAGAYYVEVPDENGNTRRVLISPDANMQDIFKGSQALNEARRSLAPAKVNLGDGFIIDVKPKLHKNGQPEWEYVLTDGVNSEKVTLEEIRELEVKKLMKSGLLKSGITEVSKNRAN